MRERTRLTDAEALAGVQPAPMSAEEWDAMHEASAEETRAKIERIAWDVVRIIARTRRVGGP
jgi:hypothetical protein